MRLVGLAGGIKKKQFDILTHACKLSISIYLCIYLSLLSGKNEVPWKGFACCWEITAENKEVIRKWVRN